MARLCSVSLEVKMQTRYDPSQGHWPEELAQVLELREPLSLGSNCWRVSMSSNC